MEGLAGKGRIYVMVAVVNWSCLERMEVGVGCCGSLGLPLPVKKGGVRGEVPLKTRQIKNDNAAE